MINLRIIEKEFDKKGDLYNGREIGLEKDSKKVPESVGWFNRS